MAVVTSRQMQCGSLQDGSIDERTWNIGQTPHKKVITTSQDRQVVCPLDLVNREFRAAQPNELWVADYTYVSTWQGVAYVGSQYASVADTDRLNAAGVNTSVGTVGNSYDNALAETINGLYKTELVHNLGPWKSIQAFELATLNWVHWYNHERLMGTIGYVPTAECDILY